MITISQLRGLSQCMYVCNNNPVSESFLIYHMDGISYVCLYVRNSSMCDLIQSYQTRESCEVIEITQFVSVPTLLFVKITHHTHIAHFFNFKTLKPFLSYLYHMNGIIYNIQNTHTVKPTECRVWTDTYGYGCIWV